MKVATRSVLLRPELRTACEHERSALRHRWQWREGSVNDGPELPPHRRAGPTQRRRPHDVGEDALPIGGLVTAFAVPP